MTEYFVHAHTYAAPFVSNTIHNYAPGDTPQAALDFWVAGQHNTIYAADLYTNADAFHRGHDPLCRFASPKALAREN